MKKMQQTRQYKSFAEIKQVTVEGTRRKVVTVQCTQLVQSSLLRRANVQTKVLIITAQQNSAEFLLSGGGLRWRQPFCSR